MEQATKEKLMLGGVAALAGAALLPALSLAGGKTENVGGRAGPYIVPTASIFGGVALAALVDNVVAQGAGVALAALGGYMLVATAQASRVAKQGAAGQMSAGPHGGGGGGAHGGGGGHGGHGGGGHGGHGGHGHHRPPPWWGGGGGWGWWGPGWTYVLDGPGCSLVLDPYGNEWCVYADGTRTLTRTAQQIAAQTRSLTAGAPARPLNLSGPWLEMTGSGTLPPSFARRRTGMHRTWMR